MCPCRMWHGIHCREKRLLVLKGNPGSGYWVLGTARLLDFQWWPLHRGIVFLKWFQWIMWKADRKDTSILVWADLKFNFLVIKNYNLKSFSQSCSCMLCCVICKDEIEGSGGIWNWTKIKCFKRHANEWTHTTRAYLNSSQTEVVLMYEFVLNLFAPNNRKETRWQYTVKLELVFSDVSILVVVFLAFIDAVIVLFSLRRSKSHHVVF